MTTNRRTIAVVLGPMLALACAACTLLVNPNSTQCQTDTDCAQFGTHPVCQSGVCVSSGLGPTNCFEGNPTTPNDFLNQCSAAECLSFDNCARIGMCADGGADAALLTPAVPEAGASTPAPPPSMNDGAAPPTMPSCMDPNNGRSQVVYMTGSSNFPPLLAKLAPLIVSAGYTPVFQVTNSCTGVSSVFNTQQINDPTPGPGAKYATYFNLDGTSAACLLGSNGASVDVGESDIFSTTCGFGAAADPIGEYLGPIQAMTIVVPGKSREVAISAEAARAVFGMAGDNNVAAPWTDPSLYFVRNANTGTQQMVGLAINVPPASFWGIDRGSAANVDALLRVISDDAIAEQAIGIISADYYDSDRANLKALAFKATDQDCAYLPDSTPFKTDKQNVRDGHYPIWGPLHFFATTSNGVPVSPAAQAFLSVVSVPNLPITLVNAFIGSSLVPSCAMGVQRSTELGALSSYAAPFQCSCYFEWKVNGVASPGCTACTGGTECTDPKRPACNLGYCEVQ